MATRQEHTSQIPGYTYAIQAFCALLLIIGIANLQILLSVQTLSAGISLGVWIAVFYSIATAMPGYIFLRKCNAFLIAMVSQAVLIVVVSAILAVWK